MGTESVVDRVPTVRLSWNEVTGAVGDSVTVVPIVVGVAVLTDRSLVGILLWFGVFQIVWGLRYGVPVSVEPMKALAAMVVAGALTTDEFLVAGLIAGGVLLVVGASGTLGRIERYIGEPVVRGVQFAVALLLGRTGVGLAAGEPWLATAAGLLAVGVVALGHRKVSALVVLLAGGAVAAMQPGAGVSPPVAPTVPTLPSGVVTAGAALTAGADARLAAALTGDAIRATVGQLAMTVGNAAVATSLLIGDCFDREVSPDDLSTSMGVMNLIAVPLGGLPMCHGSGGLAGKYAFGARTAGANVILGTGYVVVALTAVGLVAAYPLSVLGIILLLVALELGRTGLQSDDTGVVVGVGVLGLLVDVGTAFVVGVVVFRAVEVWRAWRGVGE